MALEKGKKLHKLSLYTKNNFDLWFCHVISHIQSYTSVVVVLCNPIVTCTITTWSWPDSIYFKYTTNRNHWCNIPYYSVDKNGSISLVKNPKDIDAGLLKGLRDTSLAVWCKKVIITQLELAVVDKWAIQCVCVYMTSNITMDAMVFVHNFASHTSI